MTRTVPPASRTRSLMLSNPRPLLRPPVLAESNPFPSSVIVSSALAVLRTRRTLAWLACACLIVFRSTSCATRYRHNSASGPMAPRSSSARNVTSRACCRRSSSQWPFNAATSPACVSTPGWRSCERKRMFSASAMVRCCSDVRAPCACSSASVCRPMCRLRLLRAIEIPASCWLTSSCRSRAMRVRSASCATMSRPARF